MKTKILTSLLLISAVSAVNIQNVSAQDVPAFPTAEGFGKWASGGRGGQVVEVTTLADDADDPIEGSLRWALKQYSKEPITVVFRVSGIIELEADLRCNRTAGTTIAGQTAPGDGICIRGGKCNFGGCQNLIIRHLRFRIGLDDDNNFLAGGSIGIENASNWIIDHCTFGWSGEENMTIYDNTLTTVQWSIVHEGLYDAGHGKGVRGYGSQWGGQSATYHHNLLAHNKSRSPRFNGARSNDVNVLIDYVNNVNYNWGSNGACYGADWDAAGKTQHINFVGNYYKPGPAYPGTKSSKFCNNSSGENPNKLCTQWYMSGNYMEGSANTAVNSDNYKGLDYSNYTSLGYKKSDICMSKAFEVPDPVSTETAANAYKSVLAGAGAFPRDTVDRRIIEEVRTGTAKYKGSQSGVAPGIIDRPSDVGGYPTYNTYDQITDNDHDGMDDAWETANGFDPTNSEDRNIVLKSGYTVLDAYLCSLVGENIPIEFSERFDVNNEVVPAGTGTITRNPRSTSCAAGITITFTATPAFGYRFLYWSDAAGDTLSTDSVYIHIVTKAVTIQGHFGHRPSYQLTCKTSGGKPSLLSQTPQPSQLEGRMAYIEGTEVTITAADHHFHAFDHWDDGSTDPERKIIMTSDTTVTAYYTDSAYLLAWDFSTEGNKAYKANQQIDSSVTGTLYLTDEKGSSYEWEDYSTPKGGWMGQPAACNGYPVEDNAFFLIKCKADNYGKLRLSFSYGAKNHVWSRYILQYSVDEENYTDFGDIVFSKTTLEKWMSTDLTLPSECDSCSNVCIRWYPDNTTAFIGNKRWYEGFSLSEIYLLSGDIQPEPPSALPSIETDRDKNQIKSHTIYDLRGNKVSEGPGQANINSLKKGLYIIETVMEDGSGDRYLTQILGQMGQGTGT